jgi:hypothetical protein
MSMTDYGRPVPGDSGYYYSDAPTGAGWVVFAACMLGLAGTWNVIDGILAIGNSHVYGVTAEYVFSDLKTWGWIMLIAGALQIIAAFALMGGSELARWFGIGVAGLNAIVQLSFIPAAPFWAISMFAVDVFIIFGLAAYGGKRLRENP